MLGCGINERVPIQYEKSVASPLALESSNVSPGLTARSLFLPELFAQDREDNRLLPVD